MDKLENAYALYNQADGILEFMNGRKGKRIGRWAFKKDPNTNLIIKLLVVHELIEVVAKGKKQMLVLTEKGSAHLAAGGFGYHLHTLVDDKPKKSFKQHLDDLTGLLTIFGVLNAVILFASQVKQPIVIDPANLNFSGVQFVSISMYLISIMVLVEIIWITLNETQNSFKFQALYFLLCTATLGIGMLFLSEYYPLIYGLLGMIAFFALVSAVLWLFLRLVPVIITRNTAKWFSKYSKGISLVFVSISLLVSFIILYLVIYLIKK